MAITYSPEEAAAISKYYEDKRVEEQRVYGEIRRVKSLMVSAYGDELWALHRQLDELERQLETARNTGD